MKKILFVDDEAQILKSLVRVFIDKDYTVITAEGGIEGLKVLEKEDINMVISDMRMPGMDGYQFLSLVKEKYPQVMRIILSGYAEEKTVFKALQQNIAKIYMFKPWENDRLMDTITQMFETESILSGSDLLTFINNTEGIPTIEANYRKIVEAIDDDQDTQKIALEIEHDAAIATNILHLANSAFFGAKTGSVQQAVSHIGLNNTRNLVLSTSVIHTMSCTGLAGDYVKETWDHAFVTNRLMAFIYEKHIGKKIPEAYASVGLLMNVGKVFLLKYYREDFLRICALVNRDKSDILMLEKEKFNVNHNEAGAYLLKWWEFPYPIVEATLYHDHPKDERIINKELVYIAHIASYYAQKIVNNRCQSSLDMQVFEKLKLTMSDFESSLKQFKG